jgi:hypothetical protein
MTPTAVLSENLLLEEFGGYVYFKGALFQVEAILAKLNVSSTVSQALGSGLIRRTASFSVLSNVANGTPYVNSSITKAIWAAGTPIDSIRFSIWGIDAANLARDINQGVCFGVFEIDADTSWTESTGESVFNLLDVTVANDRIIAATTDAGATELLTFNTGYDPKVIPTVYGAIPRVKMLRGYPDIDLGAGSSTKAYFSGTVPEDYDTVATSIVLESPSYDSSILRQLINSGNTTVRLRMGTDEVISGTLSYNSGTNKVSITSAVRDTFYYSGKIFTRVSTWRQNYADAPTGGQAPNATFDGVKGTKPSDYDGNEDYYSRLFALSYTPNTPYIIAVNEYSAILRSEDLNQPNTLLGYMKLNVSYIDSTGAIADSQTYAAVNGFKYGMNWDSDAQLNIDFVTHGDKSLTGKFGFTGIPSNARTNNFGGVRLGSHKLIVDATGVNSVSYELDPISSSKIPVGLRNGGSSSVAPYDTVELYFRNPTVALVGGTANITTWKLIGYTGAVSFNHYLNNGYTKVDSSTKVYCEGEDGLIQIPSDKITLIEQGVTEYGYSSLIRVKLTTPPTGMNIGAKSNELYIDCAYSSDTYGADFRQIVYNLLMSSNKFNLLFSDSNLNPVTYTSVITEPNIGFICSGQSYTEMLDKILFQLSYALRWNKNGNLDYYDTIATTIDGAGLWNGNVVDANNLEENTASISVGKFKTVALDTNRDCIKAYLKAGYGAWNDPFFKPIEDRDPIGEDEEYIEYGWDCIQTKASAEWAITRFKKLGAASLYSTIRKSFHLVGGVQLLATYEPLDAALVNNYPSLTDDASLSSIMGRSGASISYVLGSANFVLQGIGLFESIDYALSIGEVNVIVIARYSQSAVDLRGCKLAEVPTKTIPVKPDPIDTSTSPGTGGAGASGGSGGGTVETPGPAYTIRRTNASGVLDWFNYSGTNRILSTNGITGELEITPPVYKQGILMYRPTIGSDSINWFTTDLDKRYTHGLLGVKTETGGLEFMAARGVDIKTDAVRTLSTVQLVDYSGTATKQDPGDSVLYNYTSLYGTTLTFDISGSPISITMGRNETGDSGLVNSDDIELHFGLRDLGITTAKLADSAVTNAKIADAAVTNIKIADVAWGKITGAPTAYTPAAHTHVKADVTDFAHTHLLSDITSTLASTTILGNSTGSTAGISALQASAEDTVLMRTGGVLTFAKINTIQINDSAITNAKIDSVAWGKITGPPATYAPSAHNHDWSAITSGKPTTLAGYGITDALDSTFVLTGDLGGTLAAPTIAANAVVTAKILDLNVTTGKLADLAVTAGKIANGAVGGTQIASGAVGAGQLASGTISPSHFAAVSGPSVLARATATGSGDPAWLLATAGTQAKFLRSNAAASTMTWDTLIEADLPYLAAYSILANNTASTTSQASIAAADGTVLRRVGSSFAFGANVVLGNSTSGTGSQKIFVTATRYVEISNVTGIITVYIDSNTSVKINTDGTIINRRSGVDYSVCDVATITSSPAVPTGSGKKGQMHFVY